MEFLHTCGAIMQVLRECQIHNFSFFFFGDNASNNNYCISLFKIQFLPMLEGKPFHIRCACYVTNLIVQERLQLFQTNLENIRSCLTSLNTSASRQQDLKHYVDNMI